MAKFIHLHYNNRLALDEIPYFRGAVIKKFENELPEDLFRFLHNHNGEGLIYSYPLVQYKLINNKVGIVLIDSACELLDYFTKSGDIQANIRNKELNFSFEDAGLCTFDLKPENELFSYKIKDWLPLNQDNYEKYRNADGIIEQFSLLESIMTGNIISMAKGLGISIESEIKCKITKVSDTKTVTFKGIRMLSFSLEFKSNIKIPEWTGLGKGVSRGFGVVSKIQ